MGFKTVRLWHAGFAVSDLDEAISLWQSLGFAVKHKFEKAEPAAHAAMLVDQGGGGVELWQFTGDSPLNEFVGRHVAFKCGDARQTAARMVEAGFTEVIPYTEGIMVNYIFLQDGFGTYFELAEVKDGDWSDD